MDSSVRVHIPQFQTLLVCFSLAATVAVGNGVSKMVPALSQNMKQLVPPHSLTALSDGVDTKRPNVATR